ncbi:saccharopine dehydrogenase C-terminal domain-containing protein [Belliella kenyensis]|uniref:Saccharopine dehydrogenase C-terminal domain-containing protein n=1 Tax=Belliella kenyensis TaxID=1472724 RepID=A0ABV8EP64_9BACT|nr:saccharopine dehydrogenase family protein [Belliella kenyensis]MCH7402819.1 saccharopine dehydrogenase NADP-binding domain-containing protein [Belliella kenyensis]MDN3602525.1 saccharopine dehydrogenase NADP-binding domain-containing protein [Belliella kenyensis]
METILIIGTGKSSTFLIEYLANSAEKKQRKIILADQTLDITQQKSKQNPFISAVAIDLENEHSRKSIIQKADIVISMLPAFLHPIIAQDCLSLRKHFFTASYESNELRKMANDIKCENLLFLNECGLDPGLDHMSAMKIIHEEHDLGNEILSFKSYTGGVLAPESEDNPWKYKFTWNPRNVVLAGQGVSRFIRNGLYKYVPYHMLFRRIENIHFDEVGDFEGYPNRDSLSYREIYGLKDIPTMLRGTLRRAGFCQSWDVFVQLGMTDDSFEMNLPDSFSKRMFINTFLPYHSEEQVESKLLDLLPWVNTQTLEKIEWLGLFSDEELPQKKGSPAAILQKILEEKWYLSENDKDMIVMQHLFEIKTKQGIKSIVSSLVCKGENQTHTAMAKTVGLPLAMAVDLFLEGKIKAKGLRLPVIPEIYNPILDLLAKENIIFSEAISFKK